MLHTPNILAPSKTPVLLFEELRLPRLNFPHDYVSVATGGRLSEERKKVRRKCGVKRRGFEESAVLNGVAFFLS